MAKKSWTKKWARKATRSSRRGGWRSLFKISGRRKKLFGLF
jgi:hypothetical protein